VPWFSAACPGFTTGRRPIFGAGSRIRGSRNAQERMGFEPQRARRGDRLDRGAPPPCLFIAVAVDFAMVAPAERDDKLVTDFAPERPALGKAQMVGV
jgi:hypothetical protein